jgi:ubiquinone/menaquinone biosynthesis C-methylase UbiE
MNLKEQVHDYWNRQPCETAIGDNYEEASLKYFDDIAFKRYERYPFIKKYAEPWNLRGKRVLEVGCGVGTDLVMFARDGADVTAIDLTERSVELAKRNLMLHCCTGDVRVADAEHLPFKDNYFDFVYSCGVLHHTTDTLKAISEIHRVLKPDHEACIMLYNKKSLVSVQMYIMFGLLRLRPFAKLDDLYSKYHESPGTKVYTEKEIMGIFVNWSDVRIYNQRTPYDLRYSRKKYLPVALGKFLVPKGLGFFNFIKAKK